MLLLGFIGRLLLLLAYNITGGGVPLAGPSGTQGQGWWCRGQRSAADCLPLLHLAFERTTFSGWVKGGLKHA